MDESEAALGLRSVYENCMNGPNDDCPYFCRSVDEEYTRNNDPDLGGLPYLWYCISRSLRGRWVCE